MRGKREMKQKKRDWECKECKECNEKGKLREDEKASDEFEDGVYGAGGDLKGGVRLGLVVWGGRGGCVDED